MNEGTPKYRATAGPAISAGADPHDQLDDAACQAFDELLEHAGELRMHICPDDPKHVDVSAEFLEAAMDFAHAYDAFDEAHEAAEAARNVAISPAVPGQLVGIPDITLVQGRDRYEIWRAGFVAGAAAQMRGTIAYLQGRGWVAAHSAVLTVPTTHPPTREEVASITYGTFKAEGASDVRA